MKPTIAMAPDLKINLEDYGIEVPLLDERVEQIYQALSHDSDVSRFFQANIVKISTKPISKNDVLLVHDLEYANLLFGNAAAKAVIQAYDLLDIYGKHQQYNSKKAKFSLEQLVQKILEACDGCYQSLKIGVDNGFCFYLHSYAGAHHAMSYMGRGFCLINDIVIALRKLQTQKKIKTAWIIDVDAHKGDGTSEILLHDESIATLSIHMKDGWPLDHKDRQQDYWIPSDVDIEIGLGEEKDYLSKLKDGLEKMKNIFPSPDLVVVVNGSDPFEDDCLPSASLMKLSQEQMLKRDQLVYHFLHNHHLPQSWLMAGGYGQEVFKIYSQFLKYLLLQNGKQKKSLKGR